MDTIRRLAGLLLVLFTGLCISVWAVWYNDGLAEIVPKLPLSATDFPISPMVGPLVFAFGSLFVAYIIWPSDQDD